MRYLRGGSILRIDLTHRTVNFDATDHYESFIGGKGINIKILFDSLDKSTMPFDPENILIFGAGPLVGTPFYGACRMDVMARSPVTGALGNSGMGGYIGPELKFAGFDHLIIEGKAERPVYIYIRDDRVEIRDASAIWGHDTYETPVLIRKDLDDQNAKVICIGQAGERLVVYATIMSGTGNAAARTGLGAIMGSKNLKAIAVHGTKGIPLARPMEFLEGCKRLFALIKEAKVYNELHKWGLSRIHDREMRNAYFLLGTQWRGWEKICEGDFLKKYIYRRVGCFSCPVACFDGYRIEGAGSGCVKCSPYGDLSWDLRNQDLMVFWKSFVDCQRYGLDARSLSNTIFWLMELYENGIISSADTDGIEMKWGSPEAILPMAKKISFREGIGNLLAEGLPLAAKKIGKGAEDLLIIAKGSPSDIHIPPVKTQGLAAAVSPIGEDAQIQSFLGYVSARKYIESIDEKSFQEAIKKYKDRAEMEVGIREAPDPRTTEGKAELVIKEEERTDVMDMAGVCTWMTSFTGLPVDVKIIAEFMTLGFGKPVDPKTLIDAAHKMHNLERAFLAKLGFTREDDKVSMGYYGRLRPKGEPLAEIGFTQEELEKMKDDYYRLRGWDIETGMPTEDTLRKYGLLDGE
jgi:aldehyde:ferredoxin oxidoreductase